MNGWQQQSGNNNFGQQGQQQQNGNNNFNNFNNSVLKSVKNI